MASKRGVIDLCSSSEDEEGAPCEAGDATQLYPARGGGSRAADGRAPKRQRADAQEAASTVGPSGRAPHSQSFSFGTNAQEEQPDDDDDAPAALPASVWGLMRRPGGGPAQPSAAATQPLQSVTHVSDTVAPSQAGSWASQPAAVAETAVAAGAPQPASDSEAVSPQLSQEQEEVAEMVRRGKNVFFTGNAGTGKSFLLNAILAELRATYARDYGDSVAVCASTGIAATHVGGTTLHSAFGIGIPKVSDDFGKAWKPENRDRIRKWRVLVVDEVSMVSGEMFENLERVTCAIRQRPDEPFGGLQLVLCGDYFQLPPIEDRPGPGTKPDAFLNRCFTFQAPAWQRCRLEQRVLTQVFRQKDQRFVNILEAVRYNEGTAEALAELQACCCRPLPAQEGVEPTQLFSRNADVNQRNTQRLAALAGDVVQLNGEDAVETLSSSANPGAEERLWRCEFFRDCLAAKETQLKVGAQVMLLRNVDLASTADRMLVNGSRGVIASFRARESAAAADHARDKAHMEIWSLWRGRQLPVVRFLNGREEVIGPELFSADVQGYGTCKRVQIPLKLAWAITIHKCQGMTLDFVRVSLRNIFACGQAYVALSRARALEGLEVTEMSSDCVKTSEVVKRFHASVRGGAEWVDDGWARAIGRLSEPPSQQPASAGGTPGRGGRGRGGWGRFGSQQGSFGGGGRYGGGSQGSQGRGRGSSECFKCGGKGHWARDCPGR